MNKIDRKIVKQQSKDLIKGNTVVLFIITFIVVMLTSFSSIFETAASTYNSTNDIINKDNTVESYDAPESSDDFDFGFFEKFGAGEGVEDFESFGFSDQSNPIDKFAGVSGSKGSGSSGASFIFGNKLVKKVVSLIGIACFFLTPLIVTLAGFYVAFVRRSNSDELDLGFELKHLFGVTFNQTYLKKLGVYFLRSMFAGLLMLLFIIPGIVYSYSSYFAFEILCEYPQLAPMDALRLSKRITKGNRGELFAFDLSFILWILLMIVTCGIAGIFVVPYIRTSRALFYQNFKIRALMEGRVTPNDFKSAQQKAEEYAQYQAECYRRSYYANNADHSSNAGNVNNNRSNDSSSDDYFYTPPQPKNDDYFADGYYYHPTQSADSDSTFIYTPPQNDTTKAENPQPQEPSVPPQDEAQTTEQEVEQQPLVDEVEQQPQGEAVCQSDTQDGEADE